MSGTIKRLHRFASCWAALWSLPRWESPAARSTSGARPCPVRTTCATMSSTFRRARNSNSSARQMHEAGASGSRHATTLTGSPALTGDGTGND